MLMNTFQVPNKPLQGPKTAGAQFYRRFISYPLFQGVRNGMYTAECGKLWKIVNLYFKMTFL